jgi:hypothetical protein
MAMSVFSHNVRPGKDENDCSSLVLHPLGTRVHHLSRRQIHVPIFARPLIFVDLIPSAFCFSFCLLPPLFAHFHSSSFARVVLFLLYDGDQSFVVVFFDDDDDDDHVQNC